MNAPTLPNAPPAPVTTKVIDRRAGITLYKTSIGTYRTERFQDDGSQVVAYFKHLFEARATMPAIPDTMPKKNLPRSEHPHNQPGYKPGSSFTPTRKK